MNEIKVIMFDLFFTLVVPKYSYFRNENDVLSITKEEWEKYAEDEKLYLKRALGQEKNPEKIIENILENAGLNATIEQKMEILKLRENRFRQALSEVDEKVINVLSELRKRGKKLCVISNADVIDVMHWKENPLSNLFHETIFSYEVGHVKPEIEIYEAALKKLKVKAENCIFVGDGGSQELKSAKEIGMKTILTGYLLKRSKEELQDLKAYADYYVEDFQDIKALI
ncbi:HAD family hydrolase [Clostridium sp. 19966]|uniref:HAD family hydrolase n=1 Tax=Clostridium sp. 19966 TaxID=2768166 RepID=UPI0028DFFA66|nr:HAD family hydrolase [Clostridium sp. 19966]MDT8719549.1 HAD family hydrolase [Clostridium sp. 19966]